MWRNFYIETTMRNYRALEQLYKKNNIRLKLVPPTKLKSNKEIKKFASEITNAIAFPEYHYLTNPKNSRNYNTYD